MIEVLVLHTLGAASRQRFETFFRERFPQVSATIVSNNADVEARIGTADVLISFGKALGPHADRIVARAPRLRWIQSLGTGVDNLADLPSLGTSVLVTSMRGIHGAAMSEFALALMLALSRDIPRFVRNQDSRIWKRWPGRVLRGKTVGILGIGAIAADLAPLCRAIGMRVVGITSSPRPIASFDRMYPRSDLAEAAREIDYLVLLVPYSTDTHHIVNRQVLASMRTGSYLINLARGGIVDETALVSALEEGWIAGAALDVFSVEPLPEQHPLWTARNVMITPHVGGLGEDFDDAVLAILQANLSCFLAGDTHDMVNLVERR